jgi:hypothetical protein
LGFDIAPEGRLVRVRHSDGGERGDHAKAPAAGTFRSAAGFRLGGSIVTQQRLARPSGVFEAKPMTQDFIFAQDVILDPDTGEILAVVRNGGVWRDGTRIAVLVGAQIYDLNGHLLGKLTAGDGSLPTSFKKLVEGKSSMASARWSHSYAPSAARGS